MKIDPAAWPFAAGLAVTTLVLGLAIHPWAAVPTAALLLFTLWFFRDPERRTPQDPGLLICPADGRLIKAGPDEISVFMNVFNVHVCRAPMAGTVESAEHLAGRFLAAFKDSASDHNERVVIVLAAGELRLEFRLIAGLIARRIVCKIAPGQSLETGQRVGLIRFGSRVDVSLPPGGRVLAKVGQRVVAGETVIAELPTADGPGNAGPA